MNRIGVKEEEKKKRKKRKKRLVSSVGAATLLRLGGLRSHGTPIPLFPPSFVRVDVVVDTTASYAGFARPWIDVRTRLTRLHVPHSAFVPQIADLWIVTFLRPILRARVKRFSSSKLHRQLYIWIRFRLIVIVILR